MPYLRVPHPLAVLVRCKSQTLHKCISNFVHRAYHTSGFSDASPSGLPPFYCHRPSAFMAVQLSTMLFLPLPVLWFELLVNPVSFLAADGLAKYTSRSRGCGYLSLCLTWVSQTFAFLNICYIPGYMPRCYFNRLSVCLFRDHGVRQWHTHRQTFTALGKDKPMRQKCKVIKSYDPRSLPKSFPTSQTLPKGIPILEKRDRTLHIKTNEGRSMLNVLS